MSEEKDVIFYTCDDEAEDLTDRDPDEAIRCHLDGMLDPQIPRRLVLDTLPKTVSLFGYARAVLPPNELDPDSVLDEIMERIEEDEYGDPDGAKWDERMTAEAVAAVKVKAQEFCSTIRANYVPWFCEQVTKEEIDVEKWVRENEPGWLEE